ncbi:choline dehydrogenase [Devosia enhydra]|uniref:Choline dehydrogenase n=1 Tax=Devosia enhydra TaxID=665118 RepID=A0A1K2HYA3_9HYPH|nr:GMC family oxidoreductase N-terminal domain-containing protein [Devosia enhydra]SFZ84643.1 choline dehydrogenase [Devosia enhydra]
MREFDYIVVGAGSAGCALAEGLSARPGVSVLLVEGGGANAHPFVSMPRGFIKIFGRKEFFRSFPVRPQLGRDAETWRYGRGLGGSSAVNGTWYLRGMPKDYDGWVARGNPGWGWDEMSRIFRGMESYVAPDADAGRGRDGPLEITASPYRSPVLDAVLAAGGEMGWPVLADINTPDTEGIGYTQSTVDRRGRRASSYRAFIAPNLSRPNLTVLRDTEVTRILVANRRATGIETHSASGAETIRARREVIVSAGVFSSPKLLQLSGIGPGHLLQSLGLAVEHDLPQVGRQLCDHAMLTMNYRLTGHPGLNREFVGWRVYWHAMRYFLGLKGLMAFTGPPVTALVSSEGDPSWPDIQFGIGPFTMHSSKARKADPGRGLIEDQPGIMFNSFHLRPRSRGSVAITSPDPLADPEVDAGWWTDDYDRRMAIFIVRLIRRLARSPALAAHVAEETVPGAHALSDEAIAEELKWMLSPGLHGTGSCSMGPDATTAVVDARLRVHGLDGLRVADCSVMPTPVSANTNGPAMALGRRAAELILEDARR